MSQIVFNKKNVSQYLEIKESEIRKIAYDASDVGIVILKNDEISLVTKKQIKKVIIKNRKARVNEVEIHCFGNNEYIAHNKENVNSYILVPMQNHIECECNDYLFLEIAYKTNKVACKHVYKYLNILGVNNLIEYAQLYDHQVENIEGINY
jgi:hypothetical protein